MGTAANELLQYAQTAREELAAAKTLAELDQVRVAYLGKEGKISGALKGLGKLPAEERPAVGQAANQARQMVEEALAERRAVLQAEEATRKAAAQQIDVTLPGRGVEVGHQHPLTLTMQRLLSIFIGLGCEVVTGPEVEWFELNWTALNYPPDHPAMDEQDSFYISDAVMLRTHTSPGQIRVIRAHHQEGCPVRTMDWRRPPLEALELCQCTPRPSAPSSPAAPIAERRSPSPTTTSSTRWNVW